MPKKTSNSKDKRLEILGVLFFAISLFIFISLLGHDASEEIAISPNATINNPMGILGVLVSHLLIKLGFGYASLILPILGGYWGWIFFSKKDFDAPLRISLLSLLLMVLISLSVAFISIHYNFQPSKFQYPGALSGQVADLLLDMFSIYGCLIFALASYLMLFRAYFDLNLYKPFSIFKQKILMIIENYKESKDLNIKEIEKRKHTNELKSKIRLDSDSLVQEKSNKFEEEIKNIGTIIDESKIVSSSVQDITLTETDDGKMDNGKTDDGEMDDGKTDDGEMDDGKMDDGKMDSDLNIEEMAEDTEVNIDQIEYRKKPRREYVLPSSDLLKNPVSVSDNLSKDELVERANYLTESLKTYGVVGKVVHVHPGPVITLFEVEPAEGVRVNKFVQLADDLARVMEASSVRVIAPIPGKSSVGIEIPNRNPATVFFKSIINSAEFAESESILTLAIGKTTSGEISTLDLSKMPHLLIAGTTGSGKSVCINTIICSILYHASPEEVKFVMIDPKKVEMTLYKSLEGYHLLEMEDINEPIVTSVDNAILALRALEKEMDRRYNVLAEAVVRNISEYNKKMEKSGEKIMPYIVLVVDELADLMMLSAKDVEAPIARLAQLARAVGIHLVIATQRPSVDVITGVIKANFPSRIAFQVASKIDSRTIIDQPGADKLIGRGDMLHLGTGSSDVFRMHNACLTLEEIESIMGHVIDQPKPDKIVLPSVRESLQNEYSSTDDGSSDELFNDAVNLVVTHQQGSISLLQRRLKVGYSRAARLIDEMEQAAIVGPFTGSKAREVLVDESYLEIIKD